MGASQSHPTVEEAIAHGNLREFIHAAKKGDNDMLIRFIDKIPQDCHKLLSGVDSYQNTALSWACQEGHSECIKTLLAAGADPNHLNHDGLTPLHLAIPTMKTENIRYLLEYKADANIPIKKTPKHTPLMIAVSKRYSECARLLIEYGANINLPRDDGKTALDLAIELEDVHTFFIFLTSGLSHDLIQTPAKIETKLGDSPSHRMMDLLLRSRGSTPSHLLEKAVGIVTVIQTANLAEHILEIVSKEREFIGKDTFEMTVKYSLQIYASFLIQSAFPGDLVHGQLETHTLSSEKKRQLRYELSKILRGIGEEFIEHEISVQVDWEHSKLHEDRRMWIVEPIDNFEYFTRGQPFSISLALLNKSTPTMGILFCPNGVRSIPGLAEDNIGKNYLQYAIRGHGAFRFFPSDFSEQPLTASLINQLDCASVICCIKRAASNPIIEHMKKHSKVRIICTYSLDGLVHLASGGVEGFIEVFSNCPAHTTICIRVLAFLFGKESGGKSSDFFGETITFSTTSKIQQLGLIVGNERVIEYLVEILHPNKSNHTKMKTTGDANTPPSERTFPRKSVLPPQRLQGKSSPPALRRPSPYRSTPEKKASSSPARNYRIPGEKSTTDTNNPQTEVSFRPPAQKIGLNLSSIVYEATPVRENAVLAGAPVSLPGVISTPPVSRQRPLELENSLDSPQPTLAAVNANQTESHYLRHTRPGHIVDIPQFGNECSTVPQYGNKIDSGMDHRSIPLERVGSSGSSRSSMSKSDEQTIDFLVKEIRQRTSIYGATHPQVLITRLRLADVLKSTNHLIVAGEHYAQILLAMSGAHGPAVEVESIDIFEVMHSLDDISIQCVDNDEFEKACYFYDVLYESIGAKLGPENLAVAHPLESLALCHSANGDISTALKYLEKALLIRKSPSNTPDAELGKLLQQIGNIYTALHQVDEADHFFQEAYKTYKDVFGEYQEEVAILCENWGGMFEVNNKLEDALIAYDKAHRIRSMLQGANHPDTLKSMENLFSVQLYINLSDAHLIARDILKRASENVDAHERMDVYYGFMGTVLCERGFYEESIQYFIKALTHIQTQTTTIPARLVTALCNLGVAYDRLCAYKVSLGFYTKAEDIINEYFGSDHPDREGITKHIVYLRKKIGDAT